MLALFKSYIAFSIINLILIIPSLALGMEQKESAGFSGFHGYDGPGPNRKLQEGMSPQVLSLLKDGGKDALLVFFGGGDLRVSLSSDALKQIQESGASIMVFDIDLNGLSETKKLFPKNHIETFSVDLCAAKEVIDETKDSESRKTIPLNPTCPALPKQQVLEISEFAKNLRPKRIYFLDYMLISQLAPYLAEYLNVYYDFNSASGKALGTHLVNRHLERLNMLVSTILHDRLPRNTTSEFIIVDTIDTAPRSFWSCTRAPVVPESIFEIMNTMKQAEFGYGEQQEIENGPLVTRPVVWANITTTVSQSAALDALQSLHAAVKKSMRNRQGLLGYAKNCCKARPSSHPTSLTFIKRPWNYSLLRRLRGQRLSDR